MLIRACVSRSATSLRAPGCFSRLRISAVSSVNLILAVLRAVRAPSRSATRSRSLPVPVTSGAAKALMLTPASPRTEATCAMTPGRLWPLMTSCVVVGMGTPYIDASNSYHFLRLSRNCQAVRESGSPPLKNVEDPVDKGEFIDGVDQDQLLLRQLDSKSLHPTGDKQVEGYPSGYCSFPLIDELDVR